ncbi:MAG: hypothetical protein CME65_13590 [Halobacteriovoraceae bacterium]|nr:hypothetical protein [Halobacteriovoraceae bacterium]|tara:strand:+ start:30708 stop:31523 length:816 start_codon:yes stop_codon:yes gene_type:complete
MAVQYLKYKLKYRPSANRLSLKEKYGVLVKNHLGRITDYMPWEEFGDMSVDSLLNEISEDRIPEFILNGWNTVWEENNNRGFLNHGFNENSMQPYVKLKYLGDLDRLKVQIERQEGKVRLDFNSGLSQKVFEHWIDGLTLNIKKKIDFIEDPYPDCKDNYYQNVAIAFDFLPAPEGCQIKIFKPLREVFVPAKRVIVTHTMGHPIGLLITHSIWSSLFNINEKEIHGMLMPQIVENYDFPFKPQGNFFIRDQEVVDRLIKEMEKSEWKDLR